MSVSLFERYLQSVFPHEIIGKINTPIHKDGNGISVAHVLGEISRLKFEIANHSFDVEIVAELGWVRSRTSRDVNVDGKGRGGCERTYSGCAAIVEGVPLVTF